MILVVGATGLLGGTIARQLLSAGEPIRALVRAGSAKTEALSRLGAELTFGDLRSRQSLEQAVRGVTRIVSTASAMSSQKPDDTIESVDRDGQCVLVDVAEKANVERFVYVSSPNSSASPLQAAKQAVEAKIRASSLSYAILRPSLFMEVWLSAALGFDHGSGRVRIYGTGENPISWISTNDVARVAVWASRSPEAHRSVLDLGGAAVTPLRVVEIFEAVTRRRFVCEAVPEGVLLQQYNSALDSRQRSFFSITLEYAKGHRFDGRTAGTGAPQPADTVEDFARSLFENKNSGNG